MISKILFFLIALIGSYIIYSDFRLKKIPNWTLGLLALVGGAWCYSKSLTGSEGECQHFTSALLALNISLLIFGIVYFFKKEPPMGAGDLKLLPLLAGIGGLEHLGLFLFCAGMVGCITALIYKTYLKQTIFPLGPALIISFIFCEGRCFKDFFLF